MARRSQARWLLVPAFFSLTIFLMIHYSVRLDNKESNQVVEIKDGFSKEDAQRHDDQYHRNKFGFGGGEAPTVTVTVKEVVTLFPDSPQIPQGSSSTSSKYKCDPYSYPGFFTYTGKDSIASSFFSTFESTNDACPVYEPSLASRLAGKVGAASTEAEPSLSNKTVILLGDETERDALFYMCKQFGGKLIISDQNSHINTHEPKTDSEDDPTSGVSGAYPRRCFLPTENLSISNYMFYGVTTLSTDSNVDNDLIPNAIKSIESPFNWKDRLKASSQAFETLHRSEPDIIFVSAGLWDLALWNKKSNDDSLHKQLSEGEIKAYSDGINGILTDIKAYFPSSRVVLRDTLFPSFDGVKSGSTLGSTLDSGLLPKKVKKEDTRKTDYRIGRQTELPKRSLSNSHSRLTAFDPLKVEQLNAVAKSIARNHGASFWPIGELIKNIPANQVYTDGIHLNKDASLAFIGNSILEYTARTPKA